MPFIKRRTLAALLLVLAAGPLWAQVKAAIADDGTERIVLKSGTDEFYQDFYVETFVKGQDGQLEPLVAAVRCQTLGSQLLGKAQSPEYNPETLLARYNLVSLWLGNLCHGKSDAVPTAEEAKAWLLGIVRSKLPGTLDRSLRTHQMLAQLYLFGAPGSPPDYPAALAFLNEELKSNASFPALCLSYVYEHGLGVPQDAAQAHIWLERAATAGNPDAKMLLIQAREQNNGAEAFSSYLAMSKAVYQPVWFRLGLMYLEGRGTEKDPCKAQEMFQNAAVRVPQSKKYLDQIRQQKLCIPTVIAQPGQASAEPPLLEPRQSTPCAVKLPADPGELHPKQIDRSRKVIHDPAEYNAYMAALNLADPRQKATDMETFVARYPQSTVKADALEQSMAAYQALGNTAKVGDTATRLLQMQPDNLRALTIIVFLARDCAARGGIVDTKAPGKELLQLAQRGLAALPEWQEAQGASLPDAGKLRDQMAAILAGAAGLGALQNKDYSTARQFYEKALAIDPTNLPDLYQLAVADLEMSPIDPNGFWYCGKAVSIGQIQNKAAAVSPYCKLRFKQHGGRPEEWDRLVSNTEKETAPPQDFAKNLSLQEPNLTPVGAVPLPPSGKGDPISMLLVPPTTTTGIGSGIGPSAVTVVPQTHAGVSRPVATNLRDPFYPESAYSSKIDGLETLEITIDVDGNVSDISVATSLGPEFDQQAIGAVKQWKFKPATKNGKPVASQEMIVIHFHPGMPTHEIVMKPRAFLDVAIAPAEALGPGSESLSSRDFASHYAWYVDVVRRTLTAAWYIPRDADVVGQRVQIGFEIQPDGSPSNVRVEQSSGVPALDQSAISTIQPNVKFGPPPTHQSVKVIVRFDFPKAKTGP